MPRSRAPQADLLETIATRIEQRAELGARTHTAHGKIRLIPKVKIIPSSA
jgi:hypothetical protein